MTKSRFSLLFPLMLLLLAVPALAAGDPNIEGGGGGMGTGSSTCYWNGDDGVRITVVTKDGGKVATFDWTNYSEHGWSYLAGYPKVVFVIGYKLYILFLGYMLLVFPTHIVYT